MTSSFEPGALLDGRYRLDRPLGDGGMGTVWVGCQVALQREVAIKTLRVTNEDLKARLRQEALALAALHHPAVVSVYDYGETADGAPFIVMELVRGESVASHLHRAGAWSATAAVQLMLPLLDGLAAAHRAGIIHRDIKPENVVLAQGFAGDEVKLIDFGIAKQAKAEVNLTAAGGLVGTPAYMAPEQLRGVAADARSDVWSVGALLYHMIAGRMPFEAAEVWAVIHQVVSESPSYPRDARGLDGGLWRILMDAMRKDPAARTQSADAMREALARWLPVVAGAAAPSGVGWPRGPTPTPLAPTLEASQARRSVLPRLNEDSAASLDELVRTKLGG